MVILSSKGEIGDFNEADQFPIGKSQFECGYYGVAMAKSIAPVGSPPALSVAQIITDAEGWYAQFNGSDAITNTAGMSLPQLYSLLKEVGLHFQSTATDINVVKKWLPAGYPVIIAITEASVHDLALGDANPYPWNPAGTHIILVTGVASDGNVLVRDSANCTDLYNPNSLRPGPRKYDASKLQLVSATVVVPPWMPRPASDVPPVVQASTQGVPQGWKDDGKHLTAPNGHYCRDGFRLYVLSHHWDTSNVPLQEEQSLEILEGSNPSLGGGTRQVFNETVLEWTQSRGVFVAYSGKELLWRENVYAHIYDAYQQLKQSNPQAAQQALAQIKSIVSSF